MKTRITELLGVRYPIICAGMSGVATPDLAAAVSNAGGLGLINLTTLSADQARSALVEVRRLTDKPFGINTTQLLPAARDNILIAIEEKVPVTNTAFGKCNWYRDDAHRYGGKIIITTSTLKHALAAQEQGELKTGIQSRFLPKAYHDILSKVRTLRPLGFSSATLIADLDNVPSWHL